MVFVAIYEYNNEIHTIKFRINSSGCLKIQNELEYPEVTTEDDFWISADHTYVTDCIDCSAIDFKYYVLN